jgi:hypothetical protein
MQKLVPTSPDEVTSLLLSRPVGTVTIYNTAFQATLCQSLDGIFAMQWQRQRTMYEEVRFRLSADACKDCALSVQ